MGPDVTTPSSPFSAQRRRRRRPARAFTLLECALAMVILAVGVLALIEAQGYFYTANQFSSQAPRAPTWRARCASACASSPGTTR